MVKWETMWEGLDSQEVGLEAATLERVRNSSLVELSCAENVTGLKLSTEATDLQFTVSGRGAFRRSVKRHREEPWRYRKCECRYE